MSSKSFSKSFLLPAVPFLLIVTLVGTTAMADEVPPPATPDASTRHGSAFVDPLGFLLFGPRIGVEAGAGRWTGAVYGRWFDGGLLSRSLFLKTNDKFAFSYGAGARGRYYFSDGMEGFSAGLAVEYLHTLVENHTDLVSTSSTYVVPLAEAGYRMAFAQFYAGVTAAVGYAARVSGKVEDLPGGNSASRYSAVNESSVYGQASLEIGAYF
jgi:hypothetical protein